ncbi:hypothetical protein AHiyo4_14560 [Arthrobacter sp. Hiyo4]|nr:hypothetical protein AHiyo4_14560 [Arthrobacter sp. Hiyo4]
MSSKTTESGNATVQTPRTRTASWAASFCLYP